MEARYVLEGSNTVETQAGSKSYSAGQSLQLPADEVHVTLAGPLGAKVQAAWVRTPGVDFNTLVLEQ